MGVSYYFTQNPSTTMDVMATWQQPQHRLP